MSVTSSSSSSSSSPSSSSSSSSSSSKLFFFLSPPSSSSLLQYLQNLEAVRPGLSQLFHQMKQTRQLSQLTDDLIKLIIDYSLRDYFDHIYGEWETRKFNALDIIERIHPLFVFAISPKAISRPSLPSEHSPLASVETSNGLKILNTLCQHRDTNKEVLVTSCSNNRNYMEYYVFQRLSMLENYKMLTIIPEPDTHCHTMFMDATHVYIIGGRVLAGWTTSSCYSIPWNMEDNKKKKKYVEIPRMSVPRHNHVGVLLNNRYYVFGGMLENGFNTIESCEHFDITSQTWHTISSLPKPLPTRLECAVVLSDRIIAVVGRMVDSVNCKVQLYDTIANTWSTADWSLPFYSIDSGFVADCTLINGKKYLFAMLTSIDISMIIAELYSPFAIGQWTEFCIR